MQIVEDDSEEDEESVPAAKKMSSRNSCSQKPEIPLTRAGIGGQQNADSMRSSVKKRRVLLT